MNNESVDIQRLLQFVELTHEFQQVKRRILIKGEDDYENDMEHSFQLAFSALYLINRHKLELDAYHAMALALVHDIVEVHAGDDPAIGRTPEALQAKIARETEARHKLREEWPDFTLLHDLIDEYEARESAESTFVYALDKLLPMMNNYLDHGRAWKQQQASLADVQRIKQGRIDKHPVVEAYYKELSGMLEQHPELFYRPAENNQH